MSVLSKVLTGIKKNEDYTVLDTFMDLHHGRWQDHFDSQSRAIIAYLDIITNYLDRKFDIECLYASSAVSDPIFKDIASFHIEKSMTDIIEA